MLSLATCSAQAWSRSPPRGERTSPYAGIRERRALRCCDRCDGHVFAHRVPLAGDSIARGEDGGRSIRAMTGKLILMVFHDLWESGVLFAFSIPVRNLPVSPEYLPSAANYDPGDPP